MNTDVEWQKWGRQDPYFAVITDERYRSSKLTEKSRRTFFESGQAHVSYVMEHCRRAVGGEFNPKTALDFGCGVGRICIPLAERVESVVGVDVSPDMLAEAQRNCAQFGRTNVVFKPSNDELTELVGSFDIVHSCITLQHIETARGLRIFETLLRRISPGGVGAIQITYAKAQYSNDYGQPAEALRAPEPPKTLVVAPPDVPRRRRWLGLLGPPRTPPTPIEGEAVVEPAPAAPAEATQRDPQMAMNPYNLSKISYLLQAAGIPAFHAEFTDHGGEWGVFLFFRKPT